MNDKDLTIYAVGDIIPDRPNPERLFEPAIATLRQADIRFGQLENNLTTKGEPQAHLFGVRKLGPEKAAALSYAGFDVISFASNHHLDMGAEALLDTIANLNKIGIPVIGVGKNIDEARKPLIFDRKGMKVGFLAYSSVLPKGYEARPDRAGCAPVRVSTFYEQVDWQPGTPPRIITLADKEDLAAMAGDIKKLKQQVDVVVLSIHWGIHFVPRVIAMYQKEIGHAAIDAGADIIIGHHPHILKGIEVYKGKVIFYSLCNFVTPSGTHKSLGSTFYGVGKEKNADSPDYNLPFDTRKSMIAKIVLSDKKIARVSYLPLYINGYAQPEVPPRNDKRFDEVVSYTKDITESEGLNAKYEVDGAEVVIHA